MYDPLRVCTITVGEAFAQSEKPLDAFGKGVSAAELTAENTRPLTGKHPDPGAHAVGIWMRAVYEGIKLRCVDD